MKYPKIREIREAVVSLISPAYTSRFPQEAHTPFEKFRGKPVVDEDHCVGCETCANVCPPGAIQFVDDPVRGIRTITRDYGRCIFCGQCEAHCITGKGVALSETLFDLSTFDRNSLVETQERELILCQSCQAVITTRAHFSFIHETLGPKAFSSMMNLNHLNERLKLAAPQDTRVKVIDHLKRKDMFNIVCPNCLRQVLVKDLL
ncbi:MAG: 4Fe-4S binding protein [Bacteroidales bacterium]